MKVFKLMLSVFLIALVWITVSQYFFCPRFYFTEPKPFSGNSLYNPYKFLTGKHWVKCNFHAHTNTWNMFTNGNGTAKDICQAYSSLGYGVHCVSDYQHIDESMKGSEGFIPAYEHGYGIRKTHQTVLGADKVCWMDYLFPQTLNNKQNILNRLCRPNNIVILNHPCLRNGYKDSDIKYLSGYECMEVLNPSAISFNLWDMALSSGKAVYIVGNDDIHNVFKEKRLGSMCTWVNVSLANQKNILDALRYGRSYGMIIKGSPKELPELKSLQLDGDTIHLTMNADARHITFFGQDGRELAYVANSSVASYIVKSADTYVRTRIEYDNGTNIYLNPVFRNTPIRSKIPIVDVNGTFMFRAFGMVVIVVSTWLVLSLVFYNRTKMGKTLLYINSGYQQKSTTTI